MRKLSVDNETYQRLLTKAQEYNVTMVELLGLLSRDNREQSP